MEQAINAIDGEGACDRPLVWMHIGDLHMTNTHQANHLALRDIVAQANAHLAGSVDFAVLPGDNADDGTAEQYEIIRAELDRLNVPVHILTGDHDFKQKSLDAFYSVLGAQKLPHAITVGGFRCLFLDYVSAGTGGPDFRLGEQQLNWLEEELENAGVQNRSVVVFGHAYPDDLADADEALKFRVMLATHRVLVLDMGHTHYNELASDGTTIYAATRSTGQIEEGPAGFSLLSVDRDVVSWRFKPLNQPWPLVMITSPADRRLITRPHLPTHVPSGRTTVRARAWGAGGIEAVECRAAGGGWTPMAFIQPLLIWEAAVDLPDSDSKLEVRVTDSQGSSDIDSIEVTTAYRKVEFHADGSDRDAVGAWEDKHLLGTQLGPNRNGRKW